MFKRRASTPTHGARSRFALLAALSLFPLLIAAGPAEAAALKRGLPSAQGWFWDRPAAPEPPPGSPNEAYLVGDPISQNAGTTFENDHMYVGWDPADPDDKREMISGVAFDLNDLKVPQGSTITRFVVTILENPDAKASANETAAAEQGVVACPWPQFIAGSAAAALSEAPSNGGACNEAKASGRRNVKPRSDGLFVWTFSVTPIIAGLAQQGENTAFSLEADAAKGGIEPWAIAYREGDYTVPSDPTDPFSEGVPKPGVSASISWTPPPSPSPPSSGPAAGPINFPEEPPLQDTAAVDQIPSEQPPELPDEGPSGPRIAGLAEGPSVPFWKIPPGALVAALLGTLLLVLTGASLQSSAAGTGGRPPGAVQSMLRTNGGERA